MANVLVFYTSRKRRRTHPTWAQSLTTWLRSRGHAVAVRHNATKDLSPYSHVVIWNGEHRQCRRVESRATAAGLLVAFMEVGFFSQRSHWMFSRHGSVGGSLLRGEEVPANTPADEQTLDAFFAQYAGGRKPTTGGGPVGLLQLDRDYAIKHYSPLRTMQSFVRWAEAEYPDIRFRVHPRDPSPPVKTRLPLLRGRSLWDDLLPADLVVGINSTALYEAALAGKPIAVAGECPLRNHPPRDVVREILRRQVPRDFAGCDDLLIRSLGWSF